MDGTLGAIRDIRWSIVSRYLSFPSEHRTQHQKNTYTPVWNEQLLLPAALPSLSDRLEILLYDWDAVGNNDLISSYVTDVDLVSDRSTLVSADFSRFLCSQYFSFAEIREKGWGPEWVTFYGAPLGDCTDKV